MTSPLLGRHPPPTLVDEVREFPAQPGTPVREPPAVGLSCPVPAPNRGRRAGVSEHRPVPSWNTPQRRRPSRRKKRQRKTPEKSAPTLRKQGRLGALGKLADFRYLSARPR